MLLVMGGAVQIACCMLLGWWHSWSGVGTGGVACEVAWRRWGRCCLGAVGDAGSGCRVARLEAGPGAPLGAKGRREWPNEFPNR